MGESIFFFFSKNKHHYVSLEKSNTTPPSGPFKKAGAGYSQIKDNITSKKWKQVLNVKQRSLHQAPRTISPADTVSAPWIPAIIDGGGGGGGIPATACQ